MWQSLVEFRAVTTEKGVQKRKKTVAKYNGLTCTRMGEGRHYKRQGVVRHRLSSITSQEASLASSKAAR